MAIRTPQAKRAKLEAAFRKLPVADSNAGLVRSFISTLMDVSVEGSGVISHNFLRDRRKTAGQLRRLRDLADALDDHIDNLDGTTIDAMSSGPPIEMPSRGHGPKEYTSRTWPERGPLKTLLRSTVETAIWAIDYERETRGRLKPVEDEPRKPGRRPNERALGVAKTCLGWYETLTGKLPVGRADRKRNDPRAQPVALYMAFVAEIFDAIGLEQNPEHYGRSALQERRKARP